MCVKCRDRSDLRPCVDYVEELREEFTNLINTLFIKRMQEFIDFIEDSLEVTD